MDNWTKVLAHNGLLFSKGAAVYFYIYESMLADRIAGLMSSARVGASVDGVACLWNTRDCIF